MFGCHRQGRLPSDIAAWRRDRIVRRQVTSVSCGRETVVIPESIRGRVSCHAIVNTKTGEEIVGENDMITWDRARQIEGLGIDKVLVRSPMTCEAPLGVCRLCYGMDLATGALVEEGMAVGIIA